MGSFEKWWLNELSKFGLTIIRIWIGMAMIKYSYPVVLNNDFHSFGDWLATLNIPLPHFMAYVSKGGEFLGGIMLTLGAATRIGAFLILANMTVAVLVAGHGLIFSGSELAFSYWVIALMIFLNGPDRWSVDQLLIKRETNKE